MCTNCCVNMCIIFIRYELNDPSIFISCRIWLIKIWRFDFTSGWHNVFDFVGDPFIHPLFRLKQCEANATYLWVCVWFATFRNISIVRLLYMVKMEIRGCCYKMQDQTFITYTYKHFQYWKFSVKNCQRNKIHAKYMLMSQEVIYEHTKIITFKGRNLLSQEEFLLA